MGGTKSIISGYCLVVGLVPRYPDYRLPAANFNPFRGAVPFWGHTTTWNLTGLSIKRDNGKKVNRVPLPERRRQAGKGNGVESTTWRPDWCWMFRLAPIVVIELDPKLEYADGLRQTKKSCMPRLIPSTLILLAGVTVRSSKPAIFHEFDFQVIRVFDFGFLGFCIFSVAEGGRSCLRGIRVGAGVLCLGAGWLVKLRRLLRRVAFLVDGCLVLN